VAERLYLVGMMGAGKSTVGPLVARRLGWSFLGTDEEVERNTGRTVAELFESGGEPLFRREESKVLAEVQHVPRAVVSVGGGAVLDEGNRAVLGRSGLVVWLRARPETLAARVGDPSTRPLLGGTEVDARATLTRIEAERRSRYSETADAVVDVDGLTPAEVTEIVVQVLEDDARAEPLPGGNRGA